MTVEIKYCNVDAMQTDININRRISIIERYAKLLMCLHLDKNCMKRYGSSPPVRITVDEQSLVILCASRPNVTNV